MKCSDYYVYYFCLVRNSFGKKDKIFSKTTEAIVFITLTEVAFLISMYSLIAFFGGIELIEVENNAYISFPLAFVVYAINHYLFLWKDRWLLYQKRLNEMSVNKLRRLKWISSILTFMAWFLVAAFLIFAALQHK